MTEKVDNGVHEYYFCVKPELNRDDTELSKLLNYMANSIAENRDFGELSNSVKSNKTDEEGVTHMCELVRNYAEEYSERYSKKRYDEGILKGRLEGRSEGIAEGVLKGITEGELKAAKQFYARLIKSGMSEEKARELSGFQE